DVANRTILLGGSGRLANFTNLGSMLASNGGNISEQATVFVNQGSMRAAAGGALDVYNDWTSTGPLVNDGGKINLYGNWRTAGFAGFTHNDGTVNFYGSVDNAGSTLTLGPTAGLWVLRGATIRGGVLNIVAGEALRMTNIAGNRLQGLTINGDLELL